MTTFSEGAAGTWPTLSAGENRRFSPIAGAAARGAGAAGATGTVPRGLAGCRGKGQGTGESEDSGRESGNKCGSDGGVRALCADAGRHAVKRWRRDFHRYLADACARTPREQRE